jgi:hypothetical protein
MSSQHIKKMSCTRMQAAVEEDFPLRAVGELRMNRFYFRGHSNRI